MAHRTIGPISYPSVSRGASGAGATLCESNSADSPKLRLLDRVRAAVRSRHYSRRTEKAYVHWIKRYIFFHRKRHPAEMGAAEVTEFLTSLAVQARVAASTQNQALSALLFLYREVLGVDLPWLDGVVRAKRPQYLPVVLTRDEVRTVLQRAGRCATVDGDPPVRRRTAPAGMLPPSGQGCRLRGEPDPDPRRRTSASSRRRAGPRRG